MAHLNYLSLSPVFQKCSASKWTSSFQKSVEAAGNDLHMTHDTFRRKWDVKYISSKVQLPPLLRQRHDAAHGVTL